MLHFSNLQKPINFSGIETTIIMVMKDFSAL